MIFQQEYSHIGDNLKNWNFVYSSEFLKTEESLIWEFPNIEENKSEYMPSFLKHRMPGKIKAKHFKKDIIGRLRYYGNNNKSKYKIEVE